MKIIVAIDGTTQSEAALMAMRGLDWSAGTEIKLITVLRSYDLSFPFIPPGELAPFFPELTKSAEKALKELCTQVQQELSDCTVGYEVLQGDPKAKIIEAAKNWNANLVFVGSRGIKGVDLMFLGSVSQGVMLQSPCPVIIVKVDSEESSSIQFKNVLVAVDNSAYSEAALNWIKTIGWGNQTHIKLITVAPRLIDMIDTAHDATRGQILTLEHDALLKTAKTELESQARNLASLFGTERISHQVAEGDPRDLILQTANVMNADLIVVGSHGRTGLEKLLIGSVSQAVAAQAECSVAIVRGLAPKGADKKQMSGQLKTKT